MSDPEFEFDVEQRPVQMKKITVSEFRLFQSQAGSSGEDFEPQNVIKKPKKSLKRRVKDIPPPPAAAITAPKTKFCDTDSKGVKRGGMGVGRGGGIGEGRGGGRGEGRGGGKVRGRCDPGSVKIRKVQKMMTVKTTLSHDLLKNRFDNDLIQGHKDLPGKLILLFGIN